MDLPSPDSDPRHHCGQGRRHRGGPYALGSDSPYYYYYYRSLFSKLKRRGALGVFKSDPKAPDDSVTLEDVINKLVIHGCADRVVDQLHALQQETGEFGTLLYAAVDWKDPELGRQSMTLMAEKVLPRMQS